MNESRSDNFASSATAHQPTREWTDPTLGTRQHPDEKTWVFNAEEAEDFAFSRRRNRPHEGTLDQPMKMTFGGQWITDNGQW